MIKAKLTGDKKSGYILKVTNDMDGFTWDQSLVGEEPTAIRYAINKKLK
jgi:hypothetical protein